MQYSCPKAYCESAAHKNLSFLFFIIKTWVVLTNNTHMHAKNTNKIIFMFSFFICFHIMLFFGWLTCIDNVIGCNFMVLYATNILWTISYFWMLLLVVPSLQLFMNNSCIAKILFSMHVSIFVCAYFFLSGFFFFFFWGGGGGGGDGLCKWCFAVF